MKPEIAEKFSAEREFHGLARTVLALCEPYGAVHSFRLVHNRGAARVACFIELEIVKQQSALARALGGRLLDGTVCLDIPVPRDFAAAAKLAAPLPVHPAMDFDASRRPPSIPKAAARPLQARP